MINVIGGTYQELNLELCSNLVLGSGLRATQFLLENGVENVRFNTCGDKTNQQMLEIYQSTYEKLKFTFQCTPSEHLITFKYNFSLDSPLIYPNVNTIERKEVIDVKSENVLCFGMLECNSKIDAKCVVYDPQTSVNPFKFSDFGKANELIYVVNQNEAYALSRSKKIDEILNFFFDRERVKALIIKNGPHGATLYENKDKWFSIPSYITSNVNKIGSGDIFSAAIAFFWFKNQDLPLEQVALNASKCTANYCNNGVLKIEDLEGFDFKEYTYKDLNSKQVYIASPIFSLPDVWLVDKVREAFLNLGVNVFSPYHDIGYGQTQAIAQLDLDAINKSDVIFTILDGLDSGTLIELGYTMSIKKKIIAYHRTVEAKSLLMLSPSDISYYNDLTTAIYQCVWSL